VYYKNHDQVVEVAEVFTKALKSSAFQKLRGLFIKGFILVRYFSN